MSRGAGRIRCWVISRWVWLGVVKNSSKESGNVGDWITLVEEEEGKILGDRR